MSQGKPCLILNDPKAHENYTFQNQCDKIEKRKEEEEEREISQIGMKVPWTMMMDWTGGGSYFVSCQASVDDMYTPRFREG